MMAAAATLAVLLPALPATAGIGGRDREPPILVLEDKPAENILRIHNVTGKVVNLYHSAIEGFGAYQMFLVRYRDETGVIQLNGAEDGRWWPGILHSTVSETGRPRERLALPAASRLDIARNVGAMTWGLRIRTARRPAACQVQFRLFGFIDDDARRPLEAVSAWQPAPCPDQPA